MPLIKTPSSTGLRGASASNPNAHDEHDRPLFRTYRPAPSAHSTHLHVRPDPGSSMPFAPVNRAKFRKDHKAANDNAALDVLLATEFQSGRDVQRESTSLGLGAAGEGGILHSAKGLGPVVPPLSAGRKSFDTGYTGPGLGLGRQSSGSGSRRLSHEGSRAQLGLGRNLSEKLSLGVAKGSSSAENGEGPFRATKRRLGSARRNPAGSRRSNPNGNYGANSEDEQEELSSRALGVYIDQEGRLHDKEYDPFEKVRSLSRRKVEKRRVFGAAREDESEVGSEGSGSFVGLGGFEAAGRVGRMSQSQQTRSQGQSERGHDDETPGYGSPNVNNADGNAESMGTRTRSNTLWSEYDSGISATSPRPAGVESEFGDPLSPLHTKFKDGMNVNANTPLSPTSSHPSSNQYGQGQGQGQGQRNSSSVKTSHTSALARLEERPRSLLFPATPAQVAAQKIKERNAPQHHHRTSKVSHQTPTHAHTHTHRVNDVVIEEEPLRPPVAPFNPMFSSEKRGKSPASSIKSGKGKGRDSGESSRMYAAGAGGRRPSTQSQPHASSSFPHHLQADAHAGRSVSGVQHASSSVFSGGDMGYLPSRWARGEREFRAGEEELDKYRPMEFRGTREDQKEPEWTPGCIDNIKRNWHEISLAFRFSTHRAKKKVERKVRNM